jgi:hypothetical protein
LRNCVIRREDFDQKHGIGSRNRGDEDNCVVCDLAGAKRREFARRRSNKKSRGATIGTSE